MCSVWFVTFVVVNSRIKIPEHLKKPTEKINLEVSETEDVQEDDSTSCPPVSCKHPTLTDSNGCPACTDLSVLPCWMQARGCVTRDAFGRRQWYPNPCTLCGCHGCTKIICPVLNCFGHPIIIKPGKCCSECDFKISEDNCTVIPIRTKSLYTSFGDGSCQSDVVTHDCDKKFGTDKKGGLFKCRPVRSPIKHEMGSKCLANADVQQVVYVDTTDCIREVMESSPNDVIVNVNRFPQDVRVGFRDAPSRCEEYFASQRQQRGLVQTLYYMYI